MKQRTQLVILGVLLAVLAAIAYVVLRSESGQPMAPASGQAAAGATGPTGAQQADGASGALPTQEELDALGAWLLPKAQGEATLPSGVGFGMAAAAATTPSSGQVAKRTPVAPPLQGIIVVGGEKRALIGGEAYRQGERVAKSDLIVANIGPDSVTLRSGDGRELILPLVK